MKKKLFILVVCLILNNCGGFEFVYKTTVNDFLIKDTTDINVDGDATSEVYTILYDLIGDNNNDFPKYKLLVNASKTESAEAIKKDATATKFNIQYLISYHLYNLHNNCEVFKKEITTQSSYNVKSAGYSFGTDLSQKESGSQAINKNINEFLFNLNTLPSLNKCADD